jgi:hypothetical protein
MTDSIRRILVLGIWGVMAAVVVLLALLVAEAKPQTSRPVDFSQGTVGGVRYEAATDRPVNPSNPVDAQIVKGLPAAERHPGSKQLLLGVFVTVTNDSSRALPTAARIDLRDEAMRVYHPLALPASNPYAYRPTTLRAGETIPRLGTPPADNIAASGLLLLYRVPAFEYQNGTFELMVHDPLHSGTVRTVGL